MLVASFDIEATNLKGDYGFMLGFVFKVYMLQPGTEQRCTPKFIGPRTVVKISDAPGYRKHPWDDRYVLRRFRECWNGVHMVVSYNGLHYDVPFVTTRLMFHRMKPLEPKMHLDLYWAVTRYRLALSRKSLDRVSRFLRTHAKKDHLGAEGTWIKAAAGDQDAVRKIIDKHCVNDVETLEELYHRSLPFVRRLERK